MIPLLVLVSFALAQAPAAPPAPTLAPAIGLTANPIVETHWLSRAEPLLRWPGAQAVIATLDAGAEVTVVLRDGDQVRVRHGLDFGWVPAEALLAAPPAPAAPGAL